MNNVNSSVNSFPNQSTELYFEKVLAGNIETVRRQMASAMESLGYNIIEDEPHIVGRCGAKGWGTWYGSADVLDYARTLTVRLKKVSENSTRVTFDYLVKHGMLNKGDKDIVIQEAKTIAALSRSHAVEKICSVCETEPTDDSKFCRRCGAPLTSEQSELEILRMMAETRAAKSSVVAASFIMPLSLLLVAAAFILSILGLVQSDAFAPLMIFGGLGLLIAALSGFFAWNRLKRALEKTEPQRHFTSRRVLASLETGEFDAAPMPKNAPHSITEGTTNLLDEEWTNRREKEKVPFSGKADTNNFD